MRSLPVHARKTVASDGTDHENRMVHCPVDGRWIPADTCARCADGGVSDTPDEVRCQRAPKRRRPADETSVTAAMESRVLCIAGKTRVQTVGEALGAGSIAVVVDGSGHPVGVCTRSDLLGAHANATAAERMTPFVITLVEQASVADAIELILERGLHHIPVLSEGRVLGVVSPTSALRWVAQDLRRTRRPRTHVRREKIRASR